MSECKHVSPRAIQCLGHKSLRRRLSDQSWSIVFDGIQRFSVVVSLADEPYANYSCLELGGDPTFAQSHILASYDTMFS